MSQSSHLTRLIEQGIADRLHTGAQVYASLHGRPVIDLALGEAREGVPMTTDTLLRWMSAGKPITALAIAQQYERGRLGLDDAIATHIPDFAQRGKQAITLRHLLTHTGGFRPVTFADTDDWDTIIQRICAMPIEPGWTPGEDAGYHTLTSWFILGELVQRASGEPLSAYVRKHIFEPCGMRDSWLGMPVAQHAQYGNRIGILYDTRGGNVAIGKWHEAGALARTVPGGNATGPIRELGRFYEMLRAGGEVNGQRIVQRETIELFTARHREGVHDATFNTTLDWGLGFMVNSARYGEPTIPYGYGPHASERAFGHGGMQSSLGFADPAHGLAAAIIVNGMPGEPKHHRRMRPIVIALYEALGLAQAA